MTIEKIRPPGSGISDISGDIPGVEGKVPPEKDKDISPVEKAKFADEIKKVFTERIYEDFAGVLEHAIAKLSAGQITKQQAIEEIIEVCKKEIIPAIEGEEETIKDAASFIKEVLMEDPFIDELLSKR